MERTWILISSVGKKIKQNKNLFIFIGPDEYLFFVKGILLIIARTRSEKNSVRD